MVWTLTQTMTDTSAATPDLNTATIQDLQGWSAAEQRQALLQLFCDLAYETGEFTLSSGERSPYYINSKRVTLHPQGAVIIGHLLLAQLPPDTEAVAGLTLGADPMVSAISVASVYQNRPLPALIVRKQPKGYGTRAYIEGPLLRSGSEVVVVEDVVTTGTSALKAVERLRQAGYRVNQIIALVDRQQGGAELYAQKGLTFQALFTIPELQARLG